MPDLPKDEQAENKDDKIATENFQTPLPTNEDSINEGGEVKEPEDTYTGEQKKPNQTEPLVIVNNLPPQDNPEAIVLARNANKWAKWGTIANVTLACFTLFALAQTCESLKLAKGLASDQKVKDSITYSHDTATQRVQNEKDSLMIRLAKQSIDKAEEHFVIEKLGFLDLNLIDTDFTTFEVNKQIIFSADLRNIGEYPVHIYKNAYSVTIDTAQPTTPLVFTNMSFDLVKGFPMRVGVTGETITKDKYDKVLKGQLFIFIRGVYFFEGIAGRKRKYEYIFKIKQPFTHKGEIEMVKSINSDN